MRVGERGGREISMEGLVVAGGVRAEGGATQDATWDAGDSNEAAHKPMRGGGETAPLGPMGPTAAGAGRGTSLRHNWPIHTGRVKARAARVTGPYGEADADTINGNGPATACFEL